MIKVYRRVRTCRCRRLVVFTAFWVLTEAFVGPALMADSKASEPTKPKPSRKTPAPRPEYDRVAAKQAYEEALRAFNLGHWEDAVAGFERSYTLSGDAALLFNVAQAQRQAGNVKGAIVAYKAFLREKPETPHREMIEAKLRDLEGGAEGKLSVPKQSDGRTQPDRLTGIWEDPFEAQEAAPAQSAISKPGPAAPPQVEPGAPEAVLAATPSVVALAPSPASQKPSQARENALDLSQQAASNDSSAGSSDRWWLWTGIGAVVAAGVVTAVILSTRGSERDTSCPSGVNGCLPVGK